MADDTSKQGATDRGQVAAGETYEVAHFAKKHGMTQRATRDLIARVGNDRVKLDAAADAAKASARPAAKAARQRKPATSAPKRSAPAAPVERTPAPSAGNSIADTAKSVVETARRGSSAARKRVIAAPAAVGKSAGKALDATKAAATSRTATLIGAVAAGVVTGIAVNLGRKAVVQAPSVMAGDWLEALKVEHKLALSIFDAIEATADTQPAKRTMLLVQLKHALGKHAFTEENVIYPALRDWGDKADADKLNHDHGYVKQHLYELEALDNRSPEFLSKIAMFRADLTAHIAEEEQAIFPPLHASLSVEKNAAITGMANKEGFKLA